MNKFNLYLIEDEAAVCHSLEFLFDCLYGIKVISYNNPIALLEEFSSEWLGCILIDLFMPSMNGIELMKQLNKLSNKMPIIIMSGHGGMDAQLKSMQQGAHAFLTKPLNIDQLLKIVIPLII
jgi:FixJ family two-component response regulator